METLWAVFDTHKESYEIGGRGAVTDLHLIEKLRFLTSRALDAQLPISIKNCIGESFDLKPSGLCKLFLQNITWSWNIFFVEAGGRFKAPDKSFQVHQSGKCTLGSRV